MDPHEQQPPPSPLRILRNMLITKERHCRKSNDASGSFETRLYQGNVTALTTEIHTAEGSASRILKESIEVCEMLDQSLADGVLTSDEIAQLLRESADVEHHSLQHHRHLQRLVG